MSRLTKLNGLDLFSGIGGISYALRDYIIPIAYCEIEPYCQSVLLQNMQKEFLSKAPIWNDITTLRDALFDSGLIYQEIDIICVGFPCQDISIAGHQKGLEGKRSRLFFEILQVLDETKSPFVFLENVPNIRTKGAERVCKELAERGYDCRWCYLSASDVGAPHKRERWWLLAHSDDKRENGAIGATEGKPKLSASGFINYWKETQSPIFGMDDGIPNRMDRIKALGNSVVPQCAQRAFELLMGLTK